VAGGSVATVVAGVPPQLTTKLNKTTRVINFTNAFISSSLHSWKQIELNTRFFSWILYLLRASFHMLIVNIGSYGDETKQSAPIIFRKQ